MQNSNYNIKRLPKDVDDLLSLFSQLKEQCRQKILPKKKQLWKEAIREARISAIEFVRKQRKQRSKDGSWKKLSELDKKNERLSKKRVLNSYHFVAESRYYKKDPVYAKAVDTRREKIDNILKKIDYILLSTQKILLKYPRTKESLLVFDFKKKFRDEIFYIESQFVFWDKIDDTIDVLESIQFDIERYQQLQNLDPKVSTPWEPPKGYIGAKSIVNYHGIPRSTLQGWAKRDEIIPKKDPVTDENYYSLEWLEKKISNYKPRNKV